MEIPQVTQITDLLGRCYPGFYWEGLPYTMPDSCSQSEFSRSWEKGWKAGAEARPNCSEHYNEPYKTIYGFAYSKAQRNPVSFRSIALESLKESLSEVPLSRTRRSPSGERGLVNSQVYNASRD